MGTFKYEDVKMRIKYTSKIYDGKEIYDFHAIKIGYYIPSNANWSYDFYALWNGTNVEIVVARFGHIIAKGDF